MSLLLMLFYWVVIPYTVFWLARRSWRNSESTLSKGLVIGVVSIVFAGLWWWAVGKVWMLDRQVRALCEKDGGVKVYETVPLPPELVDKYGIIRIPVKSMAHPSDEYFYELTDYYYMKGNPSMWRLHFQVYRRADSALLGEAISYARRGGGFWGPWNESSFGCPKKSDISDLKKKIFIVNNLGERHESN